jgi:glycosyltransferase involved in cell wall biosynthesis
MISLLESTDDFELYLFDNFSQDHTWEYLNSLTDPRIKIRKRFNHNIGGAAAVNYALLSRKKDQDFGAFETRCTLKTKNFISIFQSILDADDTIVGLSGTYTMGRDQLTYYNELGKQFPDNIKIVNQYRLYKGGIWGFCMLLRYELFDHFGFFDEASYAGDIDMNQRIINGLKKELCYVLDVHCSYSSQENMNCTECMKLQNICLGNNFCMKYYLPLMRHFYLENCSELNERAAARVKERKFFCDTIYRQDSTLTSEEKEIIKKNIKFFSEKYDKHIQEVNLKK